MSLADWAVPRSHPEAGSPKPTSCLLFGETQSRLIVSVNHGDGEKLVDLCSKNNIPVSAIGTVGGDRLSINDIVDLPLTEMLPAYYESLGKLMAKA